MLAPFSFHLILEHHNHCKTLVLQAASVTPEPMGKWLAQQWAYSIGTDD
jgi:hypothetical protein